MLALTAILASVFVLNVHRSDAYLLWGALSAIILASLIVGRFSKLEQITLRVSAPRRVERDHPIVFTVEIRNGGKRPLGTLGLGRPFLPWDGQWIAPAGAKSGLSPRATTRISAQARFRRRGEHRLDPFHVAELMPFGLATGPRLAADAPSFIVVPRMADVARVDTDDRALHQPGGVAFARSSGDSEELAGVRPYRPGDPVRNLHAKSWARVGYPVVREYRPETFPRVGVLLDPRAPASAAERLEAAIELTGGVIRALIAGRVLVDMLAIGSKVHDLEIGRDEGTLDCALDWLACVERANDVDDEAVEGAIAPLAHRLSSLVVVCADWDSRRERLVESMRRRGIAVRVACVGADGGPGATSFTVGQVSQGKGLVV